MSRRIRNHDPKVDVLRDSGALHPQPEVIHDEVFASEEFFDPRDRVQVRYEMLRRHCLEGYPVTDVARSFGVSRQAFYQTQAAFEAGGIPGLLPRRRGPKRAHKCTDELLDFAEAWRVEHGSANGDDLAEAVRQRFGIRVHPRSIDRALARRKKKL